MSQLNAAPNLHFTFGPFCLVAAERLLLREGKPVALTPKVFDTLVALVERHGTLVSKGDLLKAVWQDAFVEEGSLCNAVFALRKALGDRRYIETVPKKGYRFVSAVTVYEGSLPTPAPDLSIRSATQQAERVVQYPESQPGTSSIVMRRPRNTWALVLFAAVMLLGAVVSLGRSNHRGSLLNRGTQLVSFAKHTDHISVRDGAKSVAATPGAHDVSHAHVQYGGYFLNKRTAEDLRNAIREFSEACKEDPSSAEAYAGLASSYALLNLYGSEPSSNVYPLAKAAAAKALNLNDTLSEAHSAMGAVHLYYEWDWPGADKEFLAAIALDSRNAAAHQWYGLSLAARGQFEASLHELGLAAEIDPLSLIVQTESARVLYLSQRYDEAIDGTKRVLRLDPYFLRAHIRLGEAYEMKNMRAKAIEELQRAVELSTSDVPRATLGWAYALSGRVSDARQCLSELEQTSSREPVSPYSMALLYAALGEAEPMFAHLERAYATRASAMIYLLVDPTFAAFHSDSRFLGLIRRMQLNLTGRGALESSSSASYSGSVGPSRLLPAAPIARSFLPDPAKLLRTVSAER